MPLHIDPASAVPPFEQVRAGIVAQIAAGERGVGSRLPTVRALASELELAPNTVARAYKELEAAGVIETRGRAGTFVSLDGDPVHRAGQRAAAEFVRRIRDLDIDDAAARDLVAEALRSSD
ncbi:GntR family transcriptional regulator [Microbacterium sp. NPDC089189]|uniref:GntR family transcriptional regulator n=1 Tax=Microbacterium sp. NPDC089189 TaxID=3154972 RepID=UPI003421623E